MEELVATLTLDQLIAELARRFPTMVFAGHQELLGDATKHVTRCRVNGPLPFCLGLSEIAKQHCLELLGNGEDDDLEDEE